MKKQITITEMSLVTRIIEVEVPSYYRKHGTMIAITDEAVIKIGKDSMFYHFVSATDAKYYSDGVVDALRYNPEVIEKHEFDNHLNNTIKCLTEQYQLSMNMQLDPNQQATGQQEVTEQATEQQNAQESASQDQAMEATQDSEEGSTEG
jgi:hypothetical protein